MEWNNQPAEVTFRVNPLTELPPDLPGEPVDGADGFYRLEGNLPTDLLRDGILYIQDPATRHAVDLLAPRSGERILDACAAPGGKAFLSALKMGGGDGLTCTDSNEKRLPRLVENLERLHIRGTNVRVHDWRQPAPDEWSASFDGILLDVPCSNTGVIRRRVDVKWRLQLSTIHELRDIQLGILENAAVCVAGGGRLVYSTCSLDADENRGVVDQFLQAHPDWRLVDERIILPHVHGSDGAYAARLERI